MTSTTTHHVLTTPATSARDIVAPPYAIPDGLDHLADALQGAYQDGVDVALSAATWTTDGSGDPASYARILRMLENGDPAAWDHLPTTPDLSGEWADGPTPATLVHAHLTDDHLTADADVKGEPADTVELADVLSDAWEAGRDSVFQLAVEAELAGALPDPTPRVEEVLDFYRASDDPDPLASGLTFLERTHQEGDLAAVELSGLVQAMHLVALERAGIVVRISSHGVTVEATGPALTRWARGQYPHDGGHSWPCSTLGTLESLRVVLDQSGTLVEIDHPSGDDVEGDELNAFLTDVLADVLPVDHGAWWANVGQHLDIGDPRRVAADRLHLEATNRARIEAGLEPYAAELTKTLPVRFNRPAERVARVAMDPGHRTATVSLDGEAIGDIRVTSWPQGTGTVLRVALFSHVYPDTFPVSLDGLADAMRYALDQLS